MEDQRNAKCHRTGLSHIHRKGEGKARGAGADAFGIGYEHYKPMLADHVAMESLGRFANFIATARISERLREAMACTSLVALVAHDKKSCAKQWVKLSSQ